MTLYPIDKRIGVHNSTKQRCETYHDIVEKTLPYFNCSTIYII